MNTAAAADTKEQNDEKMKKFWPSYVKEDQSNKKKKDAFVR